MKKILFLFILLSSLLSYSQKDCDTIITNSVYESHFSYKYHNPLYVKYKVWHGGGPCKRTNMHFITNGLKGSATSKDYEGSGYDEGHLCNAADFAYDCIAEEETFRFYNCLPQTPHLNRGIWKKYETKIRKISQTDSLLVVCGGIFTNTKIKGTEVYVPDYCWKVVKSLSTGNILFSLIFENTATVNKAEDIDIAKLEKTIGYKIF